MSKDTHEKMKNNKWFFLFFGIVALIISIMSYIFVDKADLFGIFVFTFIIELALFKAIKYIMHKRNGVSANAFEPEIKAEDTQPEFTKNEEASMLTPTSNENVILEHLPTPVEKPFEYFEVKCEDLFEDIEKGAKRVDRDPNLLRECIEQLIDEFKKNYFISLYDEYIVDFKDGINVQPGVNFVRINFSVFKENSIFKDAIHEYIRIKELIDDIIKKLDFEINSWERYWFYPRQQLKRYMDSWREDFTYFVISSKEVPCFISENDDELHKLCVDNNIHIIENRYTNAFYDHTDNSSFKIKYYSVWGMVDDAATYLEYYIEKTEI